MIESATDHCSTSTLSLYALETSRLALDFLQDLSNVLPPPGGAVIALAQYIITIVDVSNLDRFIAVLHDDSHCQQTIKGNAETCRLIRDRLLRAILVATTPVERTLKGAAHIPEDLIQKLVILQSSVF